LAVGVQTKIINGQPCHKKGRLSITVYRWIF